MDAIDLKILDILQQDSNITAKELGAKLSLSATPIYERIKKLEKQGYIKGYVALLDPILLDKGLTVFISISIKDHQKKARMEFMNTLLRLEDIVEFYHISGTHDFMAKVRFSNIKEYRDFLVDKVAPAENIADISSQIVLEEIKSTTQIKIL